MNSRMCCIVAVAAILSGTAAIAEPHKYDTWVEDYTVQALLGAARYSHLKFDIEDSSSSSRTDLSTMPQLGGAWGTLPIGDRLQAGLETSFLLGFQVDKINYIQAGGSGLHVSLSTSLWMFDFSGGAYANLYLDPNCNIRLYAGGGPLMMYVSYRTDRDYREDTEEDVVETETAFGIGAYARTGIEFRIYEDGLLGFGARGTWSDVDFSDVGGSTDLTGVALFATFTAGF